MNAFTSATSRVARVGRSHNPSGSSGSVAFVTVAPPVYAGRVPSTDPATASGGDSPTAFRPGWALRVACWLVILEGVSLVILGGLELINLSAGRLVMGVTTTIFFLAYGIGLMLAARALLIGENWARGLTVFAQLVQLGVAWSFRGGSTDLVALVLALVALTVIAGLFHPASLRALDQSSVNSDSRS